MSCRSTSEHSFQAWLLGVLALFSSLVGLGQTALGAWLIIFSRSITPILGATVRGGYYAYCGVAAFSALTGFLGFVGAQLRRACLLSMYATWLGGSMLFLILISVFTFLEQNKVSIEQLETRIQSNPDYFETINFHFNCRLGSNNGTAGNFESNATDENLLSELGICSDFVLRQLWTLTWAEIGLSGFHVCLQFVLLVMAILMIRLIKNWDRVLPVNTGRHERDTFDEEPANSTAPLFSNSTPTPSAPPLPGVPIAPNPSHYNINTTSRNHTGRASDVTRPQRHSFHFTAGSQDPQSPRVLLPSSRTTSTTKL